MRPVGWFILLFSVSLAGLTGYRYALIDWGKDMQTGVYAANHGEIILETTAIQACTPVWPFAFYVVFEFVSKRGPDTGCVRVGG